MGGTTIVRSKLGHGDLEFGNGTFSRTGPSGVSETGTKINTSHLPLSDSVKAAIGGGYSTLDEVITAFFQRSSSLQGAVVHEMPPYSAQWEREYTAHSFKEWNDQLAPVAFYIQTSDPTTSSNELALYAKASGGTYRFFKRLPSSGAVSYVSDPLVLAETTAPTTAANEVALYSKDVTGVSELFCRKESSGTEIQVTSGTGLNVSAGWTGLDNGTASLSFTTNQSATTVDLSTYVPAGAKRAKLLITCDNYDRVRALVKAYGATNWQDAGWSGDPAVAFAPALGLLSPVSSDRKITVTIQAGGGAFTNGKLIVTGYEL